MAAFTNRPEALDQLNSGEIACFYDIRTSTGDVYAASFDGNTFETYEAANEAIKELRAMGGKWDIQWWIHESRGALMGSPTDRAIRDLQSEAGQAGDEDMIEICETALNGSGREQATARKRCAAVIAEASARAAE